MARQRMQDSQELTVTCWWFFAAALIMAGPPMSMFSTAVSYEGACSAVTVCRKGYKFTTTYGIVRKIQATHGFPDLESFRAGQA